MEAPGLGQHAENARHDKVPGRGHLHDLSLIHIYSEPQRFLRGTIATGDRFVSGAEAKAAAIAATQGDCVEMEGAAIAHVAAKNGIDCLVLRAISDNCDESYDALSSREFDLEEYAKSASSLVLSIVRRLAVQLGIEPRD